MTDTANPVRVFFGAELRRKRDEAGLTQEQLAEKLGCTPGWISTMESGRKISEQSAKDLDTFFNTGNHFHRLWKLANDIELVATLPPGFSKYAEREMRAGSIDIHSALLVNGLFQTEEYATAVMSASDANNAAELVAKRMERQQVLTKENPPHVRLVLKFSNADDIGFGVGLDLQVRRDERPAVDLQPYAFDEELVR